MKKINQACNFDEFNSNDWNFYVKNKPVTVTECENACYDNTQCTGFEISQYGTPNSPYCALWYNMACYVPDKHFYDINVTTYSISDRNYFFYQNWFALLFIFIFLFFCICLCICANCKNCRYNRTPKQQNKVYFAEVVNETSKNENEPIVIARVL